MKLKELRKQHNLTQDELAKILQISQRTYCGYELQTSEPSIETLCKIADHYNVSLDYLGEHETKHLIDISGFSDEKKQIIKLLEKLDDRSAFALLSYITHIFEKQK